MLPVKQIVQGAQYLLTCQKRKLQHPYNEDKKIPQGLNNLSHDLCVRYGYKTSVSINDYAGT